MRPALLGSLLILAACSDATPQPFGEPETPPTGEMYTISGMVVDSLSGGGIPGVRVAAGRFITYADAGGQWSLTLPAGPVTVSASPEGYEPASVSFTLTANAYVDLSARRLAPLVQSCIREGDQVHALVSDLQGRKTVERWQRSEAYILDPAGTYRVGAPDWGYRALDYITWEVTLGPIAPEVTTIHWNVYDAEGHRFNGNCEPVEVRPPGE